MSKRKFFISFLVGGSLMTLLWGCGSSNSAAPAFQGAQHITGWETPVSHGLQYAAAPDQCRECHGQDLLGGTSKISCNNTCHVHSVPPAYSDWYTAHGVLAKGVPGVLANNVISGYLSCQNCHGVDYKGTVLSHNVDCFNANSCHVHTDGVPHDAWNGNSNDWIQHSHADVSPENAPACYKCHNRVKHHRFRYFTGSIYAPTYYNYTSFNSLLSTRDGAPAGTSPGCYNNTMCHADISKTANPAPPTYIWPPPVSPALNPPVWPAAGAPNQ